MKSKEIKDLINFISNSDLDEVKLETEEIKLHIKRKTEPVYVEASAPAPAPAPVAPVAPAPQEAAAPAQPSAEKPAANAASSDEDRYVTVKSPMIGTFYRSPSPEEGPFVSVGDSIQEGSVVCIVEAMKLFNEIESEVSGKIVQVLVENSSPVEYDQPLFLVDPA